MIRKKILIAITFFIISFIVGCNFFSATVSRTYYFGTYEDMMEIINDMEFTSGYSYVFNDLLCQESVNDANYGFSTLYRLSEKDPLRLANSSPPYFSFAYEVVNENVNVIIMYIKPRIIEEEEITLKHRKQHLITYGSLNQETNNLLEGTEVKDFFIEYHERVESNNLVAVTTYKIMSESDVNSENYYIEITFVYSPLTEDFNDEYELSILESLMESEIIFTTP
ncbi:hypothetical protein RJI07_02700 [Mycoplasmatota bacterium WC30]